MQGLSSYLPRSVFAAPYAATPSDNAPQPDVPAAWAQHDEYVPSAHEELHRTITTAKPPPRAQPVALQGDPRLLTAPRWDRVRVQPLPTDSALVREAQRHLGRPYRWGGNDLARGVDCSGFCYRVYQRAGHSVPLSWFRQEIDPRLRPHACETNGMRLVKRPRAGDVVVFGKQHVGIYVGNLNGHPMYVSANHGGKRRPGRVDIMPVSSVGIRPVYYRQTTGIPARPVPGVGNRRYGR